MTRALHRLENLLNSSLEVFVRRHILGPIPRKARAARLDHLWRDLNLT